MTASQWHWCYVVWSCPIWRPSQRYSLTRSSLLTGPPDPWMMHWTWHLASCSSIWILQHQMLWSCLWTLAQHLTQLFLVCFKKSYMTTCYVTFLTRCADASQISWQIPGSTWGWERPSQRRHQTPARAVCLSPCSSPCIITAALPANSPHWGHIGQCSKRWSVDSTP